MGKPFLKVLMVLMGCGELGVRTAHRTALIARRGGDGRLPRFDRRVLSVAAGRLAVVTDHDDVPPSCGIGRDPLPDPRSVLEHTDWADLEHAYGPARDTPVRLVQLLNEDPEVQAGALGMLDMSVLHQESLYSATAPAALYVAGVLNDPRTMTVHEDFSVWDDRPRPLRAALLEWLGMVAESAAYGETTGENGIGLPLARDALGALVAGTVDVRPSAVAR
ncbi:hypothetical protein ACGFYE_37865 [Streptomyces zaomyceticus]|uniref:hypothetical protein n=1 Tax=Streptomyces zaomyceticus TaxID=68286 RepID=UPI00371A9C72